MLRGIENVIIIFGTLRNWDTGQNVLGSPDLDAKRMTTTKRERD